MLTIADLLEALTGKRWNAERTLLSDAIIDSRLTIPSSLFVALSGERVDGHHYVDEAFKRGAIAAFIDKDINSPVPIVDIRFPLPNDFQIPHPPFCIRVEDTLSSLQKAAAFWRGKLDVQVIGITGSVGKSTTKEAVADLLGRKYSTIKNLGNFNNEIGLPLTILRMTKATQAAVLEMGFYLPGEIQFLCDIAKPRIGIVTNIGTVHAERAGNQENIARGKAELVENLPPAPDGVAILNMDDPWVRWMKDKTRAGILTYGLDNHADISARDIIGLGLDGIEFTLQYDQKSQRIRVPFLGKHSVLTTLRVAAAGIAMEMPWTEIVGGLQEGLPPLRLSAVRSRQGAIILDDTYNAAPESTIAALDLLAEMPGRHIAVLGDMLELGEYEKEGHDQVGARAAEVANQLITMGSRARMIANSAQLNGMPMSAITSTDSVKQVVELLQTTLDQGDYVLIKGSNGMRMDKIVREIEELA